MPPTIEERVAHLEGKVEEHSRGFEDIRGLIGQVDGHLVALDQKVDGVRKELGSRIDALDWKVSRQFTWLVGIQVALLLTVIGALIQG